MLPLRLSATFLLALIGVVAARPARAAEFHPFRSTWGDVIIATDTTPEGKKLRPPTPAEPAYFLGRSLGNRLGSIPGDDEPDLKSMTALVTRILARQGYVGARPGVHEPTLFLVLQWGYLRPSSGDGLWFLGYDARQDIAAPAFPGALGPEVFRRGFRSRTIQTILEDAGGPLYGIIITAFDHASAKTDDPVILWQTRIALPANGKSMANALPTMLLAAGPSIGRESDTPVLSSADNVREGRVEIRDFKVLDAFPAGEPPRGHDAKP